MKTRLIMVEGLPGTGKRIAAASLFCAGKERTNLGRSLIMIKVNLCS